MLLSDINIAYYQHLMQGMRDMLRGSLARSLRPLPPLDRLAAAWPVACGSALAGHGEIVGYEDGVVRIVVSSPEPGIWFQLVSRPR